MGNFDRLCYLLLNDPDGLLISLRFGRDINDDNVNEILSVLTDIKNEYKNSDVISKDICGLFMDFSQSIESCFGLYSTEQVQQIIEISDKIQDAMRSCVL